MRFKKLIAAVSAAAMSLSMFATVNVNAEEAEDILVGGDPSSRPYYFEYDITPDGAVNVRDAAQLANAIATGKIDTSGN